ncbi:MAG: hypothetical protein ACOYL6_09525 [Bacteriovoracaceae bacterium]
MSTNTTRWIYFLNYEQEKLSDHFFKLSSELSRLGFMLLPIKADQVHLFLQDKTTPHIVSITSNLLEQTGWRRAMLMKLNFFIKSKKIHLYHISSFGEAKFDGRKNDHYHYMKLPCKVDLLALRLAAFHEEAKSESKEWPGGKRAKLPA